MRILVINTVYNRLVVDAYAADPALACDGYDQQQAAVATGNVLYRYAELFRDDGHEVHHVWANHLPVQARWCAENGLTDLLQHCAGANGFRRFGIDASARDGAGVARPWFLPVVVEQVRRFRPDLIICGHPLDFDNSFLNVCRAFYRFAVVVHAAPMPPRDLSAYDLALSSAPEILTAFRAIGLPAEFLPLAFDPRLIGRLRSGPRRHDVTFVGQVLAKYHQRRHDFLAGFARSLPIDLWGEADWLPGALDGAAVHQHAPQWGMAMYQTLYESKLTLNTHIDAAGRYANNYRLYEATGVGTCLLTDRLDLLAESFDIGRELLAYESVDEALDLARYYLAHETAREAIAAAGQTRTLRDHSFEVRYQQMKAILNKYL